MSHPSSINVWLIFSFHVRVEVFTAVTMKNAVFWDVVPCRSCVNRHFGGVYYLHLQGRKICEQQGTSISRWLQTEWPVEMTQLYKNKKGGRVGHMGNQERGGEGSVEMSQQVAGKSQIRTGWGVGGQARLPCRHWPNSLRAKMPSMHWPGVMFWRFLERADERLPWFSETKFPPPCSYYWDGA
jgi:hypothetical protein